MGSPLNQLVADREAAQAQRILDVQFHEAEQRSSIERSTEIARSRLDEFAEHGAIGHTRSALWHAAALASHGTAAGFQTVGNVAGGVLAVGDAVGSLPTSGVSTSLSIMNSLASTALSGASSALSGTGQALSLTGNAAQATMSATGPVFGAMRSGVQSASSPGRWERRAERIYERVVDPMFAAAESAA